MSTTAERKPHKHAELIKAWADGAVIQSNRYGRWRDDSNPSFSPSDDFRVKPEKETFRFRFALMRESDYEGMTRTVDKEEWALELEQSPMFIRWLTDWIEVEV